MILADGNLIIAKVWTPHEENRRAEQFFDEHKKVATCAITELNVVRFLMQKGHTGKEADLFLKNFISRHRERFLDCDISATGVAGQCDGHRQTTDTYLAMLAKKHRTKVATFDKPFKNRFPDLVELVE
ncbi:MAG: PIN domain-containing protein [Verrucomicrobiota bacterium]